MKDCVILLDVSANVRNEPIKKWKILEARSSSRLPAEKMAYSIKYSTQAPFSSTRLIFDKYIPVIIPDANLFHPVLPPTVSQLSLCPLRTRFHALMLRCFLHQAGLSSC